MTNFIAPNKTSMEISVAKDNSHFESNFIHITSVYLWDWKYVPLLSFSEKIKLSRNYTHSLVEIFQFVSYEKSAITLCLGSKKCFCLLELLPKKNLVQNFQNDSLVNRNIFGFTVIHLWHPQVGEKVQKSKLKLGKWRMRLPEEWEVENWHVWTATHKKHYIYLYNFYGLFCSFELLKTWDEAIITVVPK